MLTVGRITPAVVHAIGYAKAMRPDNLVAVKAITGVEAAVDAQKEWERLGCGITLTTILSPYRDLAGPIMGFLDDIDRLRDVDLITVLIPEFVGHHWWAQTLHNQSALALKARLLFRPNTAVTSLPIHL